MRPFRFFSFRLLLALLLFAGIGGIRNLSAEEEPIGVDVADAATYVTAAKVNLSVGTMRVVEGKLLGTYSINVPLMKSKFEKGRIILPLSQDLEAYMRKGGTVSGKGIAEEGSQRGDRKIDARFSPIESTTNGGRIRLTIDTGRRILVFDSTYRVNGQALPVM